MANVINNLKLGKKVLLAPIVVLILMFILAAGTFLSLSNQQQAIDEIYNQRFKGYQNSAKLLNDLSVVQGSLLRVINWVSGGHDMEQVEALIKKQITTMEDDVKLSRSILESENLGEKQRALYQSALDMLLAYQTAASRVFELAPQGVGGVYVMVADQRYDALNAIFNELHELENALSAESYEQSVARSKITMTLFAVVFVLAVILALIISFFVKRKILTPVEETIVVLKKLADGDLTQSIALQSKDEIGELVESVNTMRVKMGSAVGHVIQIAGTLSDSASQEVAAIEETSASLDEIASMTRRNAENTSEANKLMNSAQQAISKAGGSMNELTQSMKEIAQASEQTQKIVKSIDEIAFQTNLLALNASVEAARAGEAGAGFAVVADEVRNLAMRATESAHGSSAFIQDIVSKVRKGEELVNMTGNVFSEVSTSSHKILSLMGEISAASEEQSQGIDQVNSAIAEINITTQQNAANAESLSASMSNFKVDMQEYDDEDGPISNQKGRSGSRLMLEGE